MKLIVGLGNPGPRYQGTRHNVGFMVVERLAEKSRKLKQEYKYNAVLAEAEVQGHLVLLAKPLTYMNLSGRAVKEIVDKKGINLEDLMVVLDDFNLELGRIRIRSKGSNGGHRGLKSVIDLLGTDRFARLRIGVGRPQGDVVDFVLSSFSQEEKPVIDLAVDRAAEALTVWLQEGIEKAMSQYN